MDTIDNIRLIENGLRHIGCELSFDNPSLFRILKESHSIFYRSMVEALRGTDNFFITGRDNDKHRKYVFKKGDDEWKNIKKGSIVDGCKKAWRYTEEKVCPEPTELGEPISEDEWKKREDWLIFFYDVLAMVQTRPFMCRLTCSKELHISNGEMVNLEWTHEKIRNVYEHFVPKLYSSPRLELQNGAVLLLTKAEFLLFESGNVSYIDHKVVIKIRDELKFLVKKIMG